MPDIYDDALNGRLAELEANLQSSPSLLNSYGGSKNLTLLAAACAGGHVDVVRFLLQKGAKVDAKSHNGCTPFFFVATRAPKNRATIAQLLIDSRANVDEVCDKAGNTPLMLAIPMTRDRDLVHVLVDNSSPQSLKAKNAKGQDAPALAAKAGMSRDLKPRTERESLRGRVIDLAVSAVMFIIAYTNSVFLKNAVGGVVKKLYGISGKMDTDLKKAIKDPQTVDDFKQNLNDFVKENPDIQKFFKKDDPFLERLAEKANALRDDMSTDLGKPENIQKLTRLSFYQPILYLDDSGSMGGNTGRYEMQRELAKRITRIATIIVPDDEAGVGLHFINNNTQVSSRLSADQVTATINSFRPQGGTALGTSLRSKILKPYVYDILDQQKQHSGILFKRPLLICIITDGAPNSNDNPTIHAAIAECKKRLQSANYEITAVKFLISQIGDDQHARRFLETLDPTNNRDLEGMVHVTAEKLDDQFKTLRDNERGLELWLLELLTSPIMERDTDDSQ